MASADGSGQPRDRTPATPATPAEPATAGAAGDSDSPPVRTAQETIDDTHRWFATNSGWAPPDPDTLAEWAADGFSRAPDDCVVAIDGWCEHGLASWPLVLDTVDSYGRPEAGRNRRSRSTPFSEPSTHDPAETPDPGDDEERG